MTTTEAANSHRPSATSAAVESGGLGRVEVDIYRDIHKGIRAELFGVTTAAGNVDPGDPDAVEAGSERLRALTQLLISHAEHEEQFLQPVVKQHAPELAEIIIEDHVALEKQMACIEVLSDRIVDAVATERRRMTHRLYLALASFTADYLQHQAFEELEIAPALAGFVSADELVAIDRAIVASIPPEAMTTGLSLMLPAMNIEDRTEMLAGMKHGAPPQVLAGVQALAQSVLAPSDYAALAARVGAA